MPPNLQPSLPVRGNRQRQRTRTAILNAGQRLFAARPLEDITIDEIVEAAEVAKGSFYNHFTDKEHLAASVRELIQGDCEFHIFSANRDVADPPMRIARALCIVLRYTQDHPDRIQALLSLSERKTVAGSPLNVGVTADIDNGISSGRLHGVDRESGVLVVLGLVHIAIAHLVDPQSGAAAGQLAANVGAAILRALGMDHAEAARLASHASQEILGGEA
jgi:AcrR family transcriptional regulator